MKMNDNNDSVDGNKNYMSVVYIRKETTESEAIRRYK